MNLKDFLNEAMHSDTAVILEEDDEKSIKSEKDFKEYAENKFKTVFKDKLNKDTMNQVIQGILDKYADDAENGNWGKLVGVLNKSF